MSQKTKVDTFDSQFNAIGWYTKESAETVRKNIITELISCKDEYIEFLNEDDSMDEYIERISDKNSPGDNLTLIIAAQYYQINISLDNEMNIIVKEIEDIDLYLQRHDTYYSVLRPIVTVFDDPVNYNVKHPLNTEWSLWTSVKVKESKTEVNWMDTVKNIITVNTVEDFWAMFNNIPQASQLNHPFDYYFFRKDIQPMWEDSSNINGGKLTLMFKKTCDSEFIDKVWMYTILACIGEQFEDSICGVVLNVRKHQDRINIWVNTDKEQEVKNLAEKWKEIIEVKNMSVSYIKHNNKDVNYII
jgi:translation initiation factor 4E